ncbi:mRNA (guanine-N(7))-methyltransferase [Kipferlia bialata]|uniref:mRNA (guanine-N(7))-methyltransferase n=1 Tax=Kipferlia bialata TaxID=797122 RepID=A0A9K3D218_9EUKA|nr:mRNA (guanine-N(7))-methyltransferase [Kipferlia bialata]|eukprot:g7623.t1
MHNGERGTPGTPSGVSRRTDPNVPPADPTATAAESLGHFYSQDAKDISRHYSGHQTAASSTERAQSAIFMLREFNNWVKAVLISHFGVSNNAALDLCGGKFGDLSKYMGLGASYVAVVDIALLSLREGILRFNQTLVKLGSQAACLLEEAGREVTDEAILSRISEQAPVVDFIWGDCFMHNLRDHFKQQGTSFPFVSCQFAMHYAFETEQRARCFFQNVGSLLQPNHHFVATIPNKRVILDRLSATNWTYSPEDPTPPKVGNGAYHIRFDALSGPVDTLPEFGARYTFFLADAVDGDT